MMAFEWHVDPEKMIRNLKRNLKRDMKRKDERIAKLEAALLECTMNHAQAPYIAQAALREDSDE